MDLAPPPLRRQVNEAFFGGQVRFSNNPVVVDLEEDSDEYEHEDFPDSDEEEEEAVLHVCTDPNNCTLCSFDE